MSSRVTLALLARADATNPWGSDVESVRDFTKVVWIRRCDAVYRGWEAFAGCEDFDVEVSKPFERGHYSK